MINQKTIRTIHLALCLLFLFTQISLSQSDKAKKIDEYLTPFVKAGHFSGVVLASENGKVIYEKAFAIANADFKIPNQLNTRIGIASITKPMTVVILNRMIESGNISLDDKLSKYILGFSEWRQNYNRYFEGSSFRYSGVMPPELETVPYT